MKFLDKLNLRRFAKAAAVAAVGGTILFGGNAVVDAATPDGMDAFREAYFARYQNTRLFDQDFSLISPNFHLDVDSKVQFTADGKFTMGGELNWTYTNLKRNYSTNSTIPFYAEQVGNDELKFYVRRNGRWSYMLLPGMPAGIINLLKSNDTSLFGQNLDAVKNVEVIKDTADMRVMNVTLDGQKVAAILEQNSQSTFAHVTGDALARQREMFNRWLTAIRANDITFSWTVNKPSWETVTAAFDFTNIIRVYSRYVLDQAAAGTITLTEEERDLLDAMGYYAELKSYTSYVAPRDEILVKIPAEPMNATENDEALDDIFYEVTTVVQK